MTIHANGQWQLDKQTLDPLAAVLTSHWTAAKSQHAQFFWPKSSHWLKRQATRLIGEPDSTGASESQLVTT